MPLAFTRRGRDPGKLADSSDGSCTNTQTRARSVLTESERALASLFGAYSCRRTGVHFAGICARCASGSLSSIRSGPRRQLVVLAADRLIHCGLRFGVEGLEIAVRAPADRQRNAAGDATSVCHLVKSQIGCAFHHPAALADRATLRNVRVCHVATPTGQLAPSTVSADPRRRGCELHHRHVSFCPGVPFANAMAIRACPQGIGYGSPSARARCTVACRRKRCEQRPVRAAASSSRWGAAGVTDDC